MNDDNRKVKDAFENTVRGVMNRDATEQMQSTSPELLPETVEINGITYRRESGWVDSRVNQIKNYQEIAKRTGLSLRQVFWFQRGFGDGTAMPD